MAIIYRVAIDVFNIVDHHLRARQDQTPAMSTVPQDSGTPTDSITTPSQTSPNMLSGQQSGGPTSSPLLFFVALGFGVVFTNLWIIVGVKYCFRYNARNRAMRNGNDVDPINLDNLHARPHRRRREKKLMTMDEVNERFPLTKYKTWAASRAREGLPTSGGVSRPQSNTNSEINLNDSPEPHPPDIIVSPEVQPKPKDLKNQVNPSDDVATQIKLEEKNQEVIQISEKNTHSATENNSNYLEETLYPQTLVTPVEKKVSVTTEDDEDDEEDQINIAVSPELLTSPGDSCAICIDTLEEEDEVRGLSCGHAFHAGCLDPWLTSRRACCPLCKADYYIPKTRSYAENLEAERLNRGNNGPATSQHPHSVWNTILASSRLIRLRPFSNDRITTPNTSNTISPLPNNSGQATTAVSANEGSQTRRFMILSPSTVVSNFNFSVIRTTRRNRSTADEPRNSFLTSPSQLEAGARR